MRATELQELQEMAAKFEATARKLPSGPGRDGLLLEIGRFREQIVALQSADRAPPPDAPAKQ
jgi:hypothetical protein